MLTKPKKIYSYKHNCPECGVPLQVTFESAPEIRSSIGYCTKCSYPAIVGRRGNSSTNQVWNHKDK